MPKEASPADARDGASHVLYIDDRNHPVPLVECYHATAARSLCSTRPQRFPGSALAAVDSYYCAQCWRYYDAIQGSVEQNGVCPTCCICPFCQSVVTVGFSNPENAATEEGGVAYTFFYQCENCDWTSQKFCPSLSINLSLSSPTASNTDSGPVPSLETLLATATEQLRETLRQVATPHRVDSHFTNLMEQWKQYYPESIPESSDRRIHTSSVLLRKSREQGDMGEKWSWPQLEAKLQRMRDRGQNSSATKDLQQNSTSRKYKTIQDLLQERDKNSHVVPPVKEREEFNDISFFSYQLQLLADPNIRTLSAWYPIARPLEIRHSYRSKAEVLLYNRPGIILKPKLNPLDGDSSVPFGASYGQWFRKDSSAVYVIPKIQILQHRRRPGDVAAQHSFLLQVTNPTLGAIRCRFVSSSYSGEWDFWNDENDNAQSTSYLRHVLVDPFHETVLDPIQVLTSVASSSSTVELLPAEDTLLESSSSGATLHPPMPDAVREWDPAPADPLSSLRWIGLQGETAWLEVTTTGGPETTGTSYGLPMALEIELGNGSWESSLIPVEQDGDSVLFNFVLVWTE
jgi:dynactin 4